MKTTRHNTTSKNAARKHTISKKNTNKKSNNPYREGNEVCLSPEEVDNQHNNIVKKQTNKHISKEKNFGRLGIISELAIKLARIKAGQSFLAIAQ